jgi:hypothetical protein
METTALIRGFSGIALVYHGLNFDEKRAVRKKGK